MASLSAWLWTIGYAFLPRPLGSKPVGLTVVLFGVAGFTGAVGGQHLAMLVVVAFAWAAFQAWTDVADIALRLPTALAALAALLAAIEPPAGLSGALRTGTLFVAGAAWMAVWETLAHPPWRGGAGTRELEWAVLRRAWTRARPYQLALALPTTLAAFVAGIFSISHGAWMATTVLRVMRPEASTTYARSIRRVLGTATGGVAAALLLLIHPTEILAPIALFVCYGAMQLVGPGRYGIYVFFITVVALSLATVGQPPSVGIAVIRVVLTVAGAAIAVTSSALYDRWSRAHPSG
jgi:hypothetical protein